MDTEFAGKLARKNGASVMVTLNQMNERLAMYQDQITALNKTVAEFSQRLLMIEQFVARIRIERMGRGPTEV